jgi:Na+/alanine symporter
MDNERKRGPFLTVMAVLFAILAISNFTKPLQHLREPARLGIVIFGVRFETMLSNLILGSLMGIVIAAYSYGLWRLRSWVVPLSIVYAFYVPTNLVLFWYRQTGPNIPPLHFMIVYLTFAFVGSIGTALYLGYHREKLAS